MAESILAGLTVIELGSGLAAWSAGLHLSEAGAEVCKIEAPRGDPAHGKRSVVIDPTDTGARFITGQLLAVDGGLMIC